MATYDVALTASPSSYTLRLQVDQVSQNIEANTSTVSWSLRIIKNTGTGRWSYFTKSWSVNIGGQGASGTIPNYDFRNYTELVLGSGTFVIAHNADGTQTISNSGTFTDTNVNIGSGTASGSLALTTIPRASTPTFSASSVDADTSVTINTNRLSSAFTHTIEYTFGALSGVIATGVTVSQAWTPPLSLLSEIPNSLGGTVTITLKTYSGATLIGTKSANLTLTVPASVVPDFTTVTHSETVALIASEVGAYVQARSKLAVAITGAVGAYGSTITAHRITIAGQTINAATGTTLELGQSGTLALVGTVTDSRGRQRSRTINVDVLAYAPPVIDADLFFARRSLIGGTLDEEGTYLRVDLKATVSSLINTTERNRLRYKIYTRLRGAPSYTTVADTTLSAITYNSFVAISGYPIDDSFDVLVEVLDDVGGVSSIARTLATAVVFMHWGEGLGLGKFWENGQLDVAGDGYFSGDVRALGTIYQAGLQVIDTGDVATETVAGISELATSAETITGTDPGRVVTPAGLASLTATTTRRGLAEFSTDAEARAMASGSLALTPANLAPLLAGRSIIPSSVVVGSGSATVAADGTVSFTGCSSVSLIDVFDGLGWDHYIVYCEITGQSAGASSFLRLRSSGGTDLTTNYNYGIIERNNPWATGAAAYPGGTAQSGFGFSNIRSSIPTFCVGTFQIYHPGQARSTILHGRSLFRDAGGVVNSNESSDQTTATAYPSLTFRPASGNFTGLIKVEKIA